MKQMGELQKMVDMLERRLRQCISASEIPQPRYGSGRGTWNDGVLPAAQSFTSRGSVLIIEVGLAMKKRRLQESRVYLTLLALCGKGFL